MFAKQLKNLQETVSHKLTQLKSYSIGDTLVPNPEDALGAQLIEMQYRREIVDRAVDKLVLLRDELTVDMANVAAAIVRQGEARSEDSCAPGCQCETPQ